MINLNEMTTEQLVDAYRTVNDQKKVVEETLGEMKKLFEARGFVPAPGEPVKILGTDTEMTIRMDQPWVLDTKRVKEEMGEAWYNAHSNISTRVVLTAKERKVIAIMPSKVA